MRLKELYICSICFNQVKCLLNIVMSILAIKHLSKHGNLLEMVDINKPSSKNHLQRSLVFVCISSYLLRTDNLLWPYILRPLVSLLLIPSLRTHMRYHPMLACTPYTSLFSPLAYLRTNTPCNKCHYRIPSTYIPHPHCKYSTTYRSH